MSYDYMEFLHANQCSCSTVQTTGPSPAILLVSRIKVHVIFGVAATVFAVLVARIHLLRPSCSSVQCPSHTRRRGIAQEFLAGVFVTGRLSLCSTPAAIRSSSVIFHHFFKNLSCMYKWYFPSFMEAVRGSRKRRQPPYAVASGSVQPLV